MSATVRDITRIVTFDTETTGVDTDNDRIVTAFLGLMECAPGAEFAEPAEPAEPAMTFSLDYLANPGVPIPEGAMEVHGVTNEKAQADGDTPAVVIESILNVLRYEVELGTPIVAFNAGFDLSLLEVERQRHLPHVAPLPSDAIVIDPFVLDKRLNKYRKGKGARKLGNLAPAYGIKTDASRTHAADYDCYLAGRIAFTQFASPSIATRTPAELHQRQIGWAREQAAGLQHYFRTKADPLQPDAVVDGDWPLRGRAKLQAATPTP